MDNYNQISLPEVVIANLYTDKLVITDDHSERQLGLKGRENVISNKEEDQEVPKMPSKFWLGDNLKNVVLLVDDPNNAFINERHLEFLGKILQACKLNLADTAIINIAKSKPTLQQINEALAPKFLISFNVNAANAGMEIPPKPYQPDRRNGCTFLLTATLDKMNHDTPEAKQEKGRFWISLKQIFHL